MSTFWAHRDGSVAVGDAVMTGVDVTVMPGNIQLMWWYGKEGEILYSDRLPIREPVNNLAAFVPVFNNWMLTAQNPTLRTSSGKQAPAITLTQAKAVKSELVWGLYYNKFAGLTPGVPPGDNTASVNAAIQELVAHTNAGFKSLSDGTNEANAYFTGQVNSSIANLNLAQSGADSAHSFNANSILEHATAFGSLNGQGGGSTLPISPISIPPQNGGVVPNAVSMPGNLTAGLTSPPTVVAPPVVPGGAGTGPTDPLAATRTAHLNNIAAQTTVAGVAAYDITAGW